MTTAKNWTELAEVLGISRVALFKWRKLPESPGKSLSILDWKEFKKTRPQSDYHKHQASESDDYWEHMPGECDYDEAFKRGYPPSQAKIREQVKGEIIANQERQIKVDREGGKLVDGDMVRQAAEGVRDYFMESVKGMGAEVVRGLTIAPNIRREIVKRIDGMLNARLVDAVRAAKKKASEQ